MLVKYIKFLNSLQEPKQISSGYVDVNVDFAVMDLWSHIYVI